MHIAEKVNPLALTVILLGSAALSRGRRGKSDKATEISAEGTFRTGWASLIYPQTSLSLTLSPAQDNNTITQDQLGVMSLFRTNGLTVSVILLNGVSVDDSATAYINAIFENYTLHHRKCLHQQQSKEAQETHYTNMNLRTQAEREIYSEAVEISKGRGVAV